MVAGGDTTGQQQMTGSEIISRPASHPGRGLIGAFSGGFTTGYHPVAPPALQ